MNKIKAESTEQIRHIERIIVHPNYYYLTTTNDIAIVKVNTPFRFNTYVSPVCLPKDKLQAGQNGFVTGWGEVLGE